MNFFLPLVTIFSVDYKNTIYMNKCNKWWCSLKNVWLLSGYVIICYWEVHNLFLEDDYTKTEFKI